MLVLRLKNQNPGLGAEVKVLGFQILRPQIQNCQVKVAGHQDLDQGPVAQDLSLQILGLKNQKKVPDPGVIVQFHKLKSQEKILGQQVLVLGHQGLDLKVAAQILKVRDQIEVLGQEVGVQFLRLKNREKVLEEQVLVLDHQGLDLEVVA